MIDEKEVLKQLAEVVKEGNGRAEELLESFKRLLKEKPEKKEEINYGIIILKEIIKLRKSKDPDYQQKKNLKRHLFILALIVLSIMATSDIYGVVNFKRNGEVMLSIDVNNTVASGNLSGDKVIATSPDSLEIMINSDTVKFTASEPFPGRVGLVVDKEFGVQRPYPYVLTSASFNQNSSNTSAAALTAANNLVHGVTLIKYSSNYYDTGMKVSDPERAMLANNMGSFYFLNKYTYPMIFAFNNDTLRNPDFSSVGWTGVIPVMEMTENNASIEVPLFTNNMTIEGSLDLKNNSIENVLRTVYNISGCGDDQPTGTLCYDPDFDTLKFFTASGQVLQFNQETTIPMKNREGSMVEDGNTVYMSGASGDNPEFKLARADNFNTSGMSGIVSTDCEDNEICPVVFFGFVNNIDTSSYSLNDRLYLSDTEFGNLTTTPPEFPNNIIWVATVVRVNPQQGRIFVFPRLDTSDGMTFHTMGLIGDFIQTDYMIRSLPGNEFIGQNVYCIEMNGTTGQDICHLVLQPGGMGQASVWVRGGIVVPEAPNCLNNTNRTSASCYANEGNFNWEIADFNTSIEEGADWGVTGELEVIKSIYSHKDIIANGTVYASGVDINNSFFSISDNQNNSLDFTLENLNSGSNATTIITAKNDVGGTMNIGIGSSNFRLAGRLYSNITALFSKSRGKTVFANFYNQMFLWLYNPSDDNDPTNLVEMMRLDEKGLNVSKNITAGNVFLPQHIFIHTNETISVLGANLWTNVTFTQEEADIKIGITHTYNDFTNTTFTINKDGIYDIDYDFDAIDTSTSSTDIDIAGRVIYSNGTEIAGSVFETDITKKDIETEISHDFLAELKAGDELVFQFIAEDSDVQISTHGTFGDHPESATARIFKIANLP